MQRSTWIKFSGLLSLIFIGAIVWGANSILNLSTDQFHVTGATASTVPYFDSNKKLVSSSVTPTQLGYLDATSSIQTQLNSKQASGSYITALTGDVTASGPGSSAATLATVNSNIGSFGTSTGIPTITVNAKGLITAASTNSALSCGSLSNSVASCSTDTTNAANISSGLLALARGGTHTDLSATGGTSQVLQQVTSGGNITVGQLSCGSLSNSVASCSTDTTNASNISSGTLGAARLPNPSASTLGGVESIAAVSHNYLTAISTSGVPSQARPVCADLSDSTASCSTDATNASNIGSGTLSTSRLPATISIGTNASTNGILNLATSVGSGQNISILNGGATTAYNFNLPIAVGSAGTVLTSQGGGSNAMTWTAALSNPMNAVGDIIHGGSSGASTRLGIGSTGNVLTVSAGDTVWAAPLLLPPAIQVLTSGTSQTYNEPYTFIVTSANATLAATYTDSNSHTYTVLGTIASGTRLQATGGSVPAASGTLTKTGGTGDATITYSQAVAPLYCVVEMCGGGGGGGSTGTGTTGSAGGGGNASSFGSLTANGGGGGPKGSSPGSTSAPAVGGTASGGNLVNVRGAPGGGAATGGALDEQGFPGGNGPWGGAGNGGTAASGSGSNADTNSCAGGGGAAGGASVQPGYSGAAGGYTKNLYSSPALTYTYTVGAAIGGGSTGTSGGAGGNGAAGIIIATCYFQ